MTATRNLARLSQVVTVLMQHGLQVPLARMRLTTCASWRCRLHCTWQRWIGRRRSQKPWPIAVRDALIELGPAFVKVGQILSVRTDLIPKSLAEALRSLQSHVPSVPFEQIRAVLEAELGGPIDRTFRHLHTEPIAAGSVAQVHEAELLDGSRVALKVKRPDIDATVERDLEILVWLAQKMERHSPAARRYRPAASARELQRYTLRELDFRNEARVASELRERFDEWSDVRIPKVSHASRNLLIMEYVESFPLDDMDAFERHGVDRGKLINAALKSVLAQIFDFGLFHADPHPGNLHATPTGELVLLDFGIFGRLDEELSRYCALLMWSASRGDADMAAGYLLRIASLEPDADPLAFRREITDCYRAWRGSTVEEYGFARLLYDEMTLGAKHGLIFPSDMILLGKAMMTIEGVVLTVAPDLDISREAEPYLNDLRARLFDPGRLKEAALRSLPLWWELAERLPMGGVEYLQRLLDPPRTAPLKTAGAQVVAALLAAAAIIAGAVMLASAVRPLWADSSIPGLAAMLVGAYLGYRATRGG